MATTKETSITQNYRLPQDIVEQGKAVYQESIRRQVEKPENIGRMLVINVDSGEYVLGEDVNGDDDLEVDLRALALYPNAGLFGMRIGYPASDAAGAVFRPTQEADGAR